MSKQVLSAKGRLAQKAREQRRAHRRAVARRCGWLVVAAAPFVAFGWLLLASPWLMVDKVVVAGESRLTAAQVLAAARIDLGAPLARVDTSAVAARVRLLGPVASVSVSRGWPNTVKVTVVERDPVAGVPSGKAWTLVDASGALLGRASALPAGIVRLGVLQPGPKDAATRAALTVLTGLPKPIRGLVVAVQAVSAEQVTLVLRDGRQVLWGGTSEAKAKAAALVPLLKLPGRVYDVSAPTVVTRR